MSRFDPKDESERSDGERGRSARRHSRSSSLAGPRKTRDKCDHLTSFVPGTDDSMNHESYHRETHTDQSTKIATMQKRTASWQVTCIVSLVLLSHDSALRGSFAFPVLRACDCSLQRLFTPEQQVSLDTFYHNHFSSKKRVAPLPPKEKDEVYSLVRNQDNSTVALVRLCPGREESYVFLRSLCVSRAYRRQGLALLLIQQAIDDYHARHEKVSACFCFAESSLQQLYEQAGFSHIADSTATPDWMWKLFEIIAKRMKRKYQDMQLFVKKLRDTDIHTNGVLDVILLQHSKERSRVTSTAPLLSDKEYVKKNKTFLQPLLDHVNVEILSWSGRIDNEEIQRQLHQVQGAVLVWIGGNIAAEAFQNKTTAAAPSFVILDGTWQEARTMFRKMPFLQQLPRLSVSPQWSSMYTLRKDFTGWRHRFGGSDENLLCTAEAVAALLESRGDIVGRDIVLQRLQEFQCDFGKK